MASYGLQYQYIAKLAIDRHCDAVLDHSTVDNMYVHIATFILFCTAPFWIFILAAVDIDNDNVREALAAIGIILCFLGLLYGGFWRIQMRKRFNLPAYTFCFGEPSISD